VDPTVFVLDAQPIVGAIRQEPARALFEGLLSRAARGEIELRLTVVNAGEVIYATERALGATAGHHALRALQDWPIVIVPVDLELAARAAWFKLRGGTSYADCFAAALAHRDGIPVITGDPEFRRVAEDVEIAWVDEFA
jgi:predicted nucleic acid-binding protein